MSNYTLEQLTGRPPRTWTVILSTVGLLAIAIGTMLPILNVYFHPGYLGIWWKVVYAAGALCFLVSKLFSPYTGQHMRLKRLYRIETWSAIFFCVAAFFLFYNGDMTRDSWAFTLAGGALLVFTTLQIPRIIRKELDSSDAADNQSSKKTKK
jgi:O-antigen/teichoic acid export membrane protein